MADETNNASTAQGGEAGNEPDYKAMYEQAVAQSRKWESRSKENAEKAKAYDALADGDLSPEDRLKAVTDERDQLKAAAQIESWKVQVSAETGVPIDVLRGSTLEELQEHAKVCAEIMPKGAPNAPEAGQFPQESISSERDWLREALSKK